MTTIQPIFNIITRTSNRPLFFKRCQNSIQSQTYPVNNIRRYVTFDDEKDVEDYIQSFSNLIIIETERKKRKNQNHFPFHAYLNEAIDYIVQNDAGWIMILDDDSVLTKPDSLQIIAKNIINNNNDTNKVYFWKCKIGDVIVPSDVSYGHLPINEGDFHITCFLFHSSQADLVKFEQIKNGELNVIKNLTAKLKQIWIDDVLTMTNSIGNGLRRDLPINTDVKKKLVLKPKTNLINTEKNNNTVKDEIEEAIGENEEEDENEVDNEVDNEDDNEGEEEIMGIEDEDETNDEEEEILGLEDDTDIKSNEETMPQTPPIIHNDDIITKLGNLINSNQKVFIFDENNMKSISQLICDIVNCLELEDKIIQKLEHRLLLCKKSELTTKLDKLNNDKTLTYSSMPTTTTPSLSPTSQPITNVKLQGDNFVDKVYILTNNTSNRNTALERNKRILVPLKIDYEIINCPDMSLYSYQNKIKELITTAKIQDYHHIMFLNGDDIINTKFIGLYEKQVTKITDQCNLWFLGNVKETLPKDIINTKFELDDYLFMYDDVMTAKLTTFDKARNHWKTYGHREGRYGAVDVVINLQPPVNCMSGFVISNQLYDTAIEIINGQDKRNCQNFLIELQKNNKNTLLSRPDLIIPNFANSTATAKNKQISLKNGWYYNFYN